LLINKITPVIIAKDAAITIKETLDSLTEFQEVIVYLNNSSDGTNIIASKYPNVKLLKGDFFGFGPTKNIAATYASNNWILSLDSDEVILPSLLQEIKSIELKNDQAVYVLRRDNYFLGEKVNYSGWGKDYLVRIYNNNLHKFNNNKVHEFIELSNTSKKLVLENSLKHNAIFNISQQLNKMEQYSSIFAMEKKGKKFSSIFIAIVKAIYHFIKIYIFKLGFLDGFAGFMISVSGANGVFYKYIKLYVENKK